MRAELGQKQDRVNQLRQEIAETERQLEMAQVMMLLRLMMLLMVVLLKMIIMIIYFDDWIILYVS